MTPKTFDAVPLPAVEAITAAGRATIELRGLDQSGPSYEGRLYLNNPSASAETPQTLDQGYAGNFYVYSYGITPTHTDGEQATHGALLPMRREVVATEAILRAAKQGTVASVTLVPVVPGASAAQQAALPGEAVVESVRITSGAQP